MPHPEESLRTHQDFFYWNIRHRMNTVGLLYSSVVSWARSCLDASNRSRDVVPDVELANATMLIGVDANVLQNSVQQF